MTMAPDPHIYELSANECWELLRSQVVGRLGIAIMNRPDIFPINYVVDHGSIVFRTDEGTKMAAALLGTAVAFETDHFDAEQGIAWSVVAKGTATEIDGMQELFEAAELPLFPWQMAPRHRFVRISPDDLTGRRFHVNPAAVAGTTRDVGP
ncbi:unannotated protein [freshwater metagenome]|uniref:Unannotated protein n=1 Tax=freshwater metagenome TaxID=449393 RepID=A0A6J7E9Z6_9ZZZZ|nr:pyridoxamine 5'-phosphate oxidase family protein [Actinomycetota bacterium]